MRISSALPGAPVQVIAVDSVPRKTGNTSTDALLAGGTSWWHDSAHVVGTPTTAGNISLIPEAGGRANRGGLAGTFASRIDWDGSFLMAGVMEVVFFTLVQPEDLHFFGEPVTLSRQAVYTLGFFVFWAMTAGSSALTCFLQRSPNR